MVSDNRREGSLPFNQVELWLCATDAALSGWPYGAEISYVAYDVTGLSQAQYKRLEAWMEKNPSYKRVRQNIHPPRGRANDHVSLLTPTSNIIKGLE